MDYTAFFLGVTPFADGYDMRMFSMVHVAPGSRPPSWSQNEVKVLIDTQNRLFIAAP